METNEIVENEEEIAEVTEDVVKNCKKSSNLCAGYVGVGLAIGLTIPIVYRHVVQPLITKIEDRRELKRYGNVTDEVVSENEGEVEYPDPADYS